MRKYLCTYRITEILEFPALFAHAIIIFSDNDELFPVGEIIKIYTPFDFPVTVGSLVKVEIDETQAYYS